MSGAAIIYGTDGDKFEFNYVEGIIQGTAIYHAASGASEERSYRYFAIKISYIKGCKVLISLFFKLKPDA